MTLRYEHARLRPQPPRLKDVSRRERTRQPDGNRNAKGHFVAGNDAPKGRAVKRIIKRYLGEGAANSEQVEALTQDTLALFKAYKRTLGNDAPQVQDTLARRARWGVLSAWYALKAIEVGLGTEAGDAALEMALKLDARAERLDVTALDLAQRLEAAQPKRDAIAEIEAAAESIETETDNTEPSSEK